MWDRKKRKKRKLPWPVTMHIFFLSRRRNSHTVSLCSPIGSVKIYNIYTHVCAYAYMYTSTLYVIYVQDSSHCKKYNALRTQYQYDVGSSTERPMYTYLNRGVNLALVSGFFSSLFYFFFCFHRLPLVFHKTDADVWPVCMTNGAHVTFSFLCPSVLANCSYTRCVYHGLCIFVPFFLCFRHVAEDNRRSFPCTHVVGKEKRGGRGRKTIPDS